jgi:hypothetical protein
MTDNESPTIRPAMPLVTLGTLLITKSAHELLTPEEIASAIAKHLVGDWGDLPPCDWEANNEALLEGNRLLSAYGQDDRRFWIITEADRSVTTILLPNDY